MDNIEGLNSLLKQHLFFDFNIYEYRKDKLIVAGNNSLTHSHTLELIFHNPLFLAGYFDIKTSPQEKDVIQHLSQKEETVFDKSYSNIEGYERYKIFGDESDIIIYAESLEIKWNTVLYYKPEDGFKKDENYAYWLK